jgi:hypothetical protein
LIEHAEHEFELNQRGANGETRRSTLEAARRLGAGVPELDNPVSIPRELADVFAWFVDLSGARGGTGFGPAALSFAEIAAWSRLAGIDPTPFEVSVLRRLDVAYLTSLSNGRPARDPHHRH